MSADFQHTAILAGAFLMIFAIAELLYHRLKVEAEFSRKFAHISTGLLTLLFPILLSSHWWVLLLCASFALILVLSLRYKFFPSINAIERKSHGSLLFPLSVYCAFLLYDYEKVKNDGNVDALIYFYLPILTLAICDPLAAWFGGKFPYGPFYIRKGLKTLSGSFAFFISSICLSLLILHYFPFANIAVNPFILVVLIAFCAAAVEGLSGDGIDNFTIPVTVAAILVLVS
ncbi:MAG: phosphatidate cytidylyltransferase [Saprospiraceae bacterium]